MINIFYILRKENTYVYIIILTILAIFLSVIRTNINSLDDNKKEYEYYFLLKEDDINKISNNDILIQEDCLLLNSHNVINISNKLKDNEIILAYNLDENNDFIKNNKFNIIDYDNDTYISNDKFKEIKELDRYKKIYLKKISDYENYNELIGKSDFYSLSLDVQDAKKTLSFFKVLLVIILIILLILVCVIITNTIYDNLKNFKMLKLLGYKKNNMFFIIIMQILIILLIPFCILLI